MEQSLEAATGKKGKEQAQRNIGDDWDSSPPALTLFNLGGRGADYTQPTFKLFRRGKGQRGKE